MTTTVTRYDLSQLVGITPKLLRFFEELFTTASSAATDASGAAQATGSIQAATVLTLSPNAAFDNERVLVQGSGITLDDNGSTLTISAGDITTVGGFQLTFNLPSDSTLNLRAMGTVPSSADGPYADDTAAAAAGIQVGEWYAATGGAVKWRQT